jgi:hypothetical protein
LRRPQPYTLPPASLAIYKHDIPFLNLLKKEQQFDARCLNNWIDTF